jgi:hypothetical protein
MLLVAAVVCCVLPLAACCCLLLLLLLVLPLLLAPSCSCLLPPATCCCLLFLLLVLVRQLLPLLLLEDTPTFVGVFDDVKLSGEAGTQAHYRQPPLRQARMKKLLTSVMKTREDPPTAIQDDMIFFLWDGQKHGWP